MGKINHHTVTQIIVKMLMVTGGTKGWVQDTMRNWEGAFELFGEVSEGSPEDRPGLGICIAQCKMKTQWLAFQNYEEFQDGDSSASNQARGPVQLSRLYSHGWVPPEERMFVLRCEGRAGQEEGSRKRKQYEQSLRHIQKWDEGHCGWNADGRWEMY